MRAWEASKNMTWIGDSIYIHSQTSRILDQLGPEGRVGENKKNVFSLKRKEKSKHSWIDKYNLVGDAPLIADPPPANSTTMHTRAVCQDRNWYIGKVSFLNMYVPNWRNPRSAAQTGSCVRTMGEGRVDLARLVHNELGILSRSRVQIFWLNKPPLYEGLWAPV